MVALTTVCAPAARAPTAAEPTFVPPRRKARVLAAEAAGPLLRTVADSVIGSDSTGAAGAAVRPVTSRSGLGAATPMTWNSAICPADEPVLEVNLSWTSATRASTGTVTVFWLAGLKA